MTAPVLPTGQRMHRFGVEIKGSKMNAKALLVMAGIGIIAGFLASLVAGGGSGLIVYLITGVLGAFVGGLVFDKAGIKLGISNPLINQIITSTVGAIIVIIMNFSRKLCKHPVQHPAQQGLRLSESAR